MAMWVVFLLLTAHISSPHHSSPLVMGVMIHRLPQVLVFSVVFVAAEEALPQFLAAVAAEPVKFVQFLFHAGE
jgi:hypothetical protein